MASTSIAPASASNSRIRSAGFFSIGSACHVPAGTIPGTEASGAVSGRFTHPVKPCAWGSERDQKELSGERSERATSLTPIPRPERERSERDQKRQLPTVQDTGLRFVASDHPHGEELGSAAVG